MEDRQRPEIGSFRGDVLQGRVVLVAGASSGINLGIAQRLVQAGARVAILSRSAERIEAARQTLAPFGSPVLARVADVRDYSAVAAVAEEVATTWGPIDIVVSGAAGNFHASAAQLSPNGFRTVVEIDLIGTFNVFRASFQHLRTPGASLVAISAPGGTHPSCFQVHANAAKAGVNMLSRCLALEWGPAGIRVNAVSPGPIAGTEGMKRLAGDPAREHAIRSRLALRRYGHTREVADLVLFLCTPEASYITGAVLDVDGGMALGDASPDALAKP